jgi:p-cumate 2,3-dioxygenase beta subunit
VNATLQQSALVRPLPRSDYEDFLFEEAALLDAWRLDEWLALFAVNAVYEVPTAGAEDSADSAEALFYIADDYQRLQHRITRLKKTTAHSEWPRSKTAHLISNVRILGVSEDTVEIGCVFITYRSKGETTDLFFGHSRYVLQGDAAPDLKIRSKRVFLDMSSLRPQGRVSILL